MKVSTEADSDLLPLLCKVLSETLLLAPGEEDWRRWVWGDLRGDGPADPGQCGAEGGVGPAAQTGAEDGGRRAQEAPG